MSSAVSKKKIPANEKAARKALHAVEIDPIPYADLATLQTMPPGATDSPYLSGGGVGVQTVVVPLAPPPTSGEAPPQNGVLTAQRREPQKRPHASSSEKPPPPPQTSEEVLSSGTSGYSDERATLFVGGVPPYVTELKLRATLERAVDQMGLFPPTSSSSRTPAFLAVRTARGYAFAEVKSTHASHVLDALQRAHLDIDGRRLTFDWAQRRQQNRDNTSNNPSSKRLKVASYPEDSRRECWFCLASPTCETHLVASVGDSCYVAQPKGPLLDEHALVVPVEHVPTCAASSDVKRDVAAYKKALAECFHKARGAATSVAFERYTPSTKRGVYHAHVQVAPVRGKTSADVVDSFRDHARRCGFDLSSSSDDDDDDAPEGTPFFVVDVFDASVGRTTTLRNRGARVPLHFGRQVLADLLGTPPEKVHWKACELDKDGETALCAAFKDLFAPFDPFFEQPPPAPAPTLAPPAAAAQTGESSSSQQHQSTSAAAE